MFHEHRKTVHPSEYVKKVRAFICPDTEGNSSIVCFTNCDGPVTAFNKRFLMMETLRSYHFTEAVKTRI